MRSQIVNLSMPNGVHIYESKHSDGDIVNEHHHQIHQFIYTLHGEGSIRIGGKSFELKQDQGVLIVPYANHSVVSDTKLTVLVLAFDHRVLDRAVVEELLNEFFEQSKLVSMNTFATNELRQLLRKMLFEQSQGKALNHLAMKLYLAEMILVVARSNQAALVGDFNSLRAEKLRQYIDAHYYEIVDSNHLSSRWGVSIRHLNNIFKDQYHMTPMQYLTEVRMGLAQKMLVETDKDIASICFEVGFETLSSFYRAFKNTTQLSPNTYRKMHAIKFQ